MLLLRPHCNMLVERIVFGRTFVHNEEPPPSRNASQTIHASKDSSSDQSRESRRQDLRTIQQRNTRSNLCHLVSGHSSPPTLSLTHTHTYLYAYKRYSAYTSRQDKTAPQ